MMAWYSRARSSFNRSTISSREIFSDSVISAVLISFFLQLTRQDMNASAGIINLANFPPDATGETTHQVSLDFWTAWRQGAAVKKIPLEDNFGDVIGKAQRGLKLADEVLAQKS